MPDHHADKLGAAEQLEIEMRGKWPTRELTRGFDWPTPSYCIPCSMSGLYSAISIRGFALWHVIGVGGGRRSKDSRWGGTGRCGSRFSVSPNVLKRDHTVSELVEHYCYNTSCCYNTSLLLTCSSRMMSGVAQNGESGYQSPPSYIPLSKQPR